MTTCIESTYAKDRDGYTLKWDPIARKQFRHHRFVYEQHHGPIPEGMVIMHTCDNPSCINIKHLRMGTNWDNMRDKVLKGRHGGTLTDQDVIDIRESSLKQVQLAEKYKVHVCTISSIKTRKTWKHL
tara:strand:+ start:148 stop:528 length:381 start_codon:yes stop_codon:yes gene_type:complete